MLSDTRNVLDHSNIKVAVSSPAQYMDVFPFFYCFVSGGPLSTWILSLVSF
jgi:hypothetical protein